MNPFIWKNEYSYSLSSALQNTVTPKFDDNSLTLGLVVQFSHS